MENSSSMRARAASTSAVTATGRDTTTRGSGRPAAAAARRIPGEMCDPTVPVPVIQVMVPSATVPASSSMAGPSAATRTGGAVVPRMSSGANAFVVTRSPVLLGASPRSSGMREARYSRM